MESKASIFSNDQISIKEVEIITERGPIKITYKLVKIHIPEEVYIISVSNKESIVYFKPICDPIGAQSIYDTLIREQVTPCTLEYILSDALE